MKNFLLTLVIFLTGTFLAYGQSKGLKAVEEGDIPIGTERRIALVIGNLEYENIAPLKNPVNDANDMTLALEKLGFEVIKATDTDYRELIGAVNRFKESLSRSDVALFYYSGHGVSYQNQNYLLPIDADISCLERIAEYGIPLNRILADIANQKVKNSFVFLDACRNVPNLKLCSSTTRDLGVNRGLVKPDMVNPNGNFVVYSTSEGSTADDNIGARNGLFTGSLLKYLTTPNLGIRQIIDLTSKEVMKVSNDKQRPGRYDELLGEFYFLTAPQSDQVAVSVPVKPAVDLEPVPLTYIKEGSFDMGSKDGGPDEDSIRHVTLKAFKMGTYETTVAEFGEFVESTGYVTDAETKGFSLVWSGESPVDKENLNWRHGADGQVQTDKTQPVIHVSYNDAMAFCRWLSSRTNRTYRLPTEAEWEYAAGNGSKHTMYSWGNTDSLNTSANVADLTAKNASLSPEFFKNYTDGYLYTAPVGKFAPNELGLHDMIGNVAEWCLDWYDDFYSSGTNNPKGPFTGTDRVIRGGSWKSPPKYSRVPTRDFNEPFYTYNYVGFRVVCE